MYGITKQTILLFLQETLAHKYLIVSDVWRLEGGGKGKLKEVCCFLFLCSRHHLIPQMICVCNPAGLVLGLENTVGRL